MKQDYQFPFERYEIWSLSIDFSANMYKLTADFPKDEKFGMISQIRRASNSVGANIAEGVSRFSEKEKARFIEISFGSLMEVAHFLFLAKRLEFIDQQTFDQLKPEIFKLSNKINSFHKVLKTSNDSKNRK